MGTRGMELRMPSKRRFQLHLLKLSHYDDDGYVIQWYRSAIPSNTLAAMYGLALDCRERHVLGPDIDIDIHEADEPIPASGPSESRQPSPPPADWGWRRWSACSLTSSPAPWTSRAASAPPVSWW
jgi:hypothetical protein